MKDNVLIEGSYCSGKIAGFQCGRENSLCHCCGSRGWAIQISRILARLVSRGACRRMSLVPTERRLGPRKLACDHSHIGRARLALEQSICRLPFLPLAGIESAAPGVRPSWPRSGGAFFISSHARRA